MKKQIIISLLLLSVIAATAQDVKQTFTRKVVIEQFTTAQCGYCPSGAETIEAAINGNTNYIWIKHHAGFYTDDLTNGIHESMLKFYGGSTYAPAMMLDRTHFDASKPGPVCSISNLSTVRSQLATAKGVETYCKVYTPEIAYDPATRHLTGTVSGRFGDVVYNENTRLVVFLIEDSIFMQQHDYYNGSSSNNYAVDYWHMGTVRDTITPLWGTTLDVNADDNHSFSYQIDYTLPESYQSKNCKIVAFVYNYNASDINDCQIMNGAISTFCDNALSIGEIANNSELHLYPNPATDRVVIESDGDIQQVMVVNALGQVVAQRNAVNAQRTDLNVADLAAGLYIVRIATANGIATRQLIVK